MSYEPETIQKIVEGAIFAAGEPLSIERIIGLFEDHEAPDQDQIKQALEQIQTLCENRGYQLLEVASGWRFQVREDLATWVNRLWEEKPQKYSRAMLETLALIAYRQPITRGDIEEVRGVAVSSHIIKTLMERDWIKVVGHRDVPGRPALYATTRQFLDYFGLKSLDELPTLGELKDIDSLDGNLAFDDTPDPDTPDNETADSETADANNANAGASDQETSTNDAADSERVELQQAQLGIDTAEGEDVALEPSDDDDQDRECQDDFQDTVFQDNNFQDTEFQDSNYLDTEHQDGESQEREYQDNDLKDNDFKDNDFKDNDFKDNDDQDRDRQDDDYQDPTDEHETEYSGTR